MTGGKFLIKKFDEKFSDYDLCKIGNNFAKDYYRDDTKFGKKYSSYTDDFCNVFNITVDENGYVSKSLYYVEDTWKNYEWHPEIPSAT